MNFKIKKIYAVAFSMLVIMITIVGFGAMQSTKVDTHLPSAPLTSDTSNLDDIIEDDNQTGAEESEEVETKPTFSNGYKCVSYALNFLETGLGYKYNMNMTVSGEVAGIVEYQSINETKIRSGNYYSKIINADCTSSLGKRVGYYYYTDDYVNMDYWETTNKTSEKELIWDSSSYKTTKPIDEVINNYDLQLYDHLTIKPDKTNSTLTKFDKSSNKDYYIVGLKFDCSKIPEIYIRNNELVGEFGDMNVTSLKFTFYISKTNGYLRQLIREECYNFKKFVTISTNAYSEYVFPIMNKTIVPERLV